MWSQIRTYRNRQSYTALREFALLWITRRSKFARTLGKLNLDPDCHQRKCGISFRITVRDYWMIYRGPDVLALVWFGSYPYPFPWASCLSFLVFLCITGRAKGGREWGRSQIIRQRESLALFRSFNTLCIVYSYVQTEQPPVLTEGYSARMCSVSIYVLSRT